MNMGRQLTRQMITSYVILSVLLWNSAGNIFSVGDDSDALMSLKISLQGTVDLDQKLKNWTDVSPPCDSKSKQSSWFGVGCLNGRVSELILENMELKGSIEREGLAELTELRRLSFKNNSLSGPLPDISGLVALKAVFFSYNNFSGPMSDDFFLKMKALKKLSLCDNHLSGEIPSSLVNLHRLMELQLQNNNFVGGIPNFDQSNLRIFNVSNNDLSGAIPDTSAMRKFNATSFDGNPDLCGRPLNVTCRTRHSHRLTTKAVIGIIAADAVVLLVITGIVLLCYLGRSAKKFPEDYQRNRSEVNVLSDDDHVSKVGVLNNNENQNRAAADQEEKLTFFGDDRPEFDIDDLLRASAELLGKGNFGNAYKAVLEGGIAMVVKRLREINSLGQNEFQYRMQALGRLKHQNLLPLTAYFYSKEEKLLVYNFIPNGSLLSLLHGDRSQPGRVPLVWKTRLKIIKGIARGLDYLHRECEPQNIPHGDLKSSNVLLDENKEPYLSDYGLATLVSPPLAAQRMMAFKAPEYIHYRIISPKADVWSFGVLLLELLTGKVSSHNSHDNVPGKEGAVIDLPRWVHSVVREEWTGEVFDREISSSRNAEGEMLQVLQIALWCAENSPEKRPNMNEVLSQIEDIRERSDDSNNYSNSQDEDDYSMPSEGDAISDYSSIVNTSDLSFTPPQQNTPQ